MNITKTEQLMLDVMAELALAEEPIVFKGAMTLKLAVDGKTQTDICRTTRDIDGDWMRQNASMEEMRCALTDAVKRVDASLSVTAYRTFSENRSAGFWILNQNEEKLFKIDLGLRRHPFYQNYIFSYQGKMVSLKGATLSKMLADKVCAISSQKVFRRAKDLIDTDIYSYCAGFDMLEVRRLAKESGHDIENFDAFQNRQADLRHAYEKLDDVVHKPDFDTLYARLSTFLKPFIENSIEPSVWNGMAWTDPQCEQGKTVRHGR